jgi:hypothetical protein
VRSTITSAITVEKDGSTSDAIARPSHKSGDILVARGP